MAETPDSKTRDSVGRFAYEGLERVIHEKARLGILASLLAHPVGLPFTDLKELCALTDGNLNRHLKVLAESGLVSIEKETEGRRPQTVCRITAQGRDRFQEYLGALEQVIADAVASSVSRPRGRSKLEPRWDTG